MIVTELLFQINPTAILILILTLLLIFKYHSKYQQSKSEIHYEQTEITYKTYESITLNEQEQTSFLVMSYNILANCFTKSEYFPYCKEDYLRIKYRAPRIVSEIEQVNPDILCLQECDLDLFSAYYLPNLQALGYSCHFKAASPNCFVVNAVCYKTALFEIEEEFTINLNDQLSQKDEAFLKNKYTTVLNLTHVPSQKRIVIANTQLYWNPDFEFVKYGQICKIINDIETKYSKDVPIILCGDLNSLPNSNVVKFVYGEKPDISSIEKGDANKNKKFIQDFWDESKHNLNLRSAYDCYKCRQIDDGKLYANNHPEFTVYTDKLIGTLDYVIYSAGHFNVTQVLNVPTQDNEVKAQKIPNHVYPSDHFKIAARFKFV